MLCLSYERLSCGLRTIRLIRVVKIESSSVSFYQVSEHKLFWCVILIMFRRYRLPCVSMAVCCKSGRLRRGQQVVTRLKVKAIGYIDVIWSLLFKINKAQFLCSSPPQFVALLAPFLICAGQY